MGLFSTTDPVAKEEKTLKKQAKKEQKDIKAAIRDIQHAEREESKAAKAESSAQITLNKAHKVEEKIAQKLSIITNKHDAASIKQNGAAHDLQLRADAHHQALAALAEKRAILHQLQQRHHSNDSVRHERLGALRRSSTSVTAGSRGAAPSITPTSASGGSGNLYNTLPAAAATGVAGVGVGADADATSYQTHDFNSIHIPETTGAYDNSSLPAHQPPVTDGLQNPSYASVQHSGLLDQGETPQVVPAQEVLPQDVTSPQTLPQEVPPKEVPPQEVLHQEVPTPQHTLPEASDLEGGTHQPVLQSQDFATNGSNLNHSIAVDQGTGLADNTVAYIDDQPVTAQRIITSDGA